MPEETHRAYLGVRINTGGQGVNSGGLGYELHKYNELSPNLVASVTRDVKIFSVRASLPCRVYAYQSDDTAFIIAIDPGHKNLR